jgi:hypothetical protein
MRSAECKPALKWLVHPWRGHEAEEAGELREGKEMDLQAKVLGGGGRKGGEAMLAFIAKIKISTMFLQKSEIIQQNLHYCSFHEVPVTTGTCPKQIRTV